MPNDEAADRAAAGAAGEPAGERPVLGTPDELSSARRRRGGFLGYLVIALVIAVMAAGWGYVLLLTGGNTRVSTQVISFDASAADSAEITFTVHKPADRAATCRLRALDNQHLEVGSRVIDVPRGKAELAFTERLRTSARAATVFVDYCDLV